MACTKKSRSNTQATRDVHVRKARKIKHKKFWTKQLIKKNSGQNPNVPVFRNKQGGVSELIHLI